MADAALADDRPKLVDELGDLLFQVYFSRSCWRRKALVTSTGRAAGAREARPATRTSSATSMRRPPGAFARTGSGSRPSRRGARGSSTTSPSRCRRCSRRARCSGARALSGSSTPIWPARWPISTRAGRAESRARRGSVARDRSGPAATSRSSATCSARWSMSGGGWNATRSSWCCETRAPVSYMRVERCRGARRRVEGMNWSELAARGAGLATTHRAKEALRSRRWLVVPRTADPRLAGKNSTVEADVVLESGAVGRAGGAPSGASTGVHEALRAA